MVREKVISTKLAGEEGFHLFLECGDVVTDYGGGFPVLRNPIAMNIHLGVIVFWVVCFTSIEDFKLHVAREVDQGRDDVVEGVFGSWAEFESKPQKRAEVRWKVEASAEIMKGK
eukprot:1714560-Ditylum_brightwellii.AAC.1